MSKDALEGLIANLDNWAAFFTLLVVIGVGGELVVHLMSSRANKRLIALQKSESLSQEAEIARLKKDSTSFELNIAKANKGVADANERVALAEQHVAEANLKAETERLARVKIEARIGPRTITPEQAAVIVASLAPFKGSTIRTRVYLTDSNDWEIGHFIIQLHDVFNKAGILTGSWGALPTPIGGTIHGLVIGISRDNANVDFATAVMQAFRNADIPSVQLGTMYSEERLGAKEIDLVVGPKQ